MKISVNIDEVTLDLLVNRLKRVVSPLDILKWLNNFNQSDTDFAIKILLNLTVYTTSEIEEVLENAFSKIIARLQKNERIVVCPVGKFGKSGSLISYLLQKTNSYKRNSTKISLVSSLAALTDSDKKKELLLVLVDDFIGTGGTVEEYFNKDVLPQKSDFKQINLVAISGMNFGIARIRTYFNKIIIPKSNIFKKAFSGEARFFGYRNHSDYRQLSYNYGKKIVRPEKTKGKRNALGFENSQALVSFSYGTPNNTLPIIWSNNDWFPLIPRFSVDRISQSKSLRKEISYELAILKEFGNDEIISVFFSRRIVGRKRFDVVNKTDFSLYSVIKLSRKGYSSVSICQILGIFDSDFEQIMTNGINKQLFDNKGELTLYGLRIYSEANRCIERRKRASVYRDENLHKQRMISYLPKTFNGKS